MEYLSRNLTFEELTMTANRPFLERNAEMARDPLIFAQLKRLALTLLQPVRDHFNRPLLVSSGFRCPELNAAIGSHPESQHILGQAADFTVAGTPLDDVYEWIRYSDLMYGQLIKEFDRWIHLSLPLNSKARIRQNLIATLAQGRTTYHEV